MSQPRPVSICECGSHAWVILTRGHVSIIDPEFAPAVGLWQWKAIHDSGNWYAARNAYGRVAGKKITIVVRLHSVIQPCSYGYVVDHINRDTLDNRRENLRLATYSQNAINKKISAGATSAFRGVSRAGDGWKAAIGFQGRQILVGAAEGQGERGE